jgi:hypothetical protein
MVRSEHVIEFKKEYKVFPSNILESSRDEVELANPLFRESYLMTINFAYGTEILTSNGI